MLYFCSSFQNSRRQRVWCIAVTDCITRCAAIVMAQRRSPVAVLALVVAAIFVGQQCSAFLPSPQLVARTEMEQAQGAVVAAGLAAAAAMPEPALAARVEEEDEGCWRLKTIGWWMIWQLKFHV